MHTLQIVLERPMFLRKPLWLTKGHEEAGGASRVQVRRVS